MKNTLRRTLVLGLSALFVASCSDDTSSPQLIGSVVVSPLSATVVAGNKQQLTVNVTDTDGNVITGEPVVWTSGNTNIATVSQTGEVTAVAAGGPILITAFVGGKTGHTALTVLPVPVATVTLTPNPASVQVGRTTNLTVTTRDANNNVLTGRTVTMTSSNANVATVTNAGVVTGVAVGSATITATSEGRTATTVVNVVAATP
ncbi:MAG TPA: Ig-like domain-containing protein [Longimicrobium sp.]|jgi:uncharacterized protein YjdB|uniref:Ig-like domain-containing protein n=1 Tax=Longimicrobium sp. TaxID=2029185 RepID=UPI002EDB0862